MIHVASAFDRNYYNPFCSFLSSLMHNSRNGSVVLHVISEDILDVTKAQLAQFVESHGNTICFYKISDFRIESLIVMSTWTKAVYYRLYFPLLIPTSVSRLLYLDADTVVVGNLAELYDQPLEGFPVAAVYDNYVKKQPLLGIEKEGVYFNSGVLLIDTQLWRQQRVTERAIEYLEKYPERILFVDQCALNAVLIDNWKRLEYRFNVLYSYVPTALSLEATKEFLRDKVVIHFTLERPWKFICRNRLRYLYHQFLAMSPSGKQSTFVDFNLSALPQWFKLHLTEFYLDSRFLQRMWRSLK